LFAVALPLLSDVFALSIGEQDLNLLNDDVVLRSLPLPSEGAAVFSLDFQSFLSAQHRVVQQLYDSAGQQPVTAAASSALFGTEPPRCAVRVSLSHAIVPDCVGMTRSHRNVDFQMDLAHFSQCPALGKAVLDVYAFEPATGCVPITSKLEGDRDASLSHGTCAWRVKINTTSYNSKARWSSLFFAVVRVSWPNSDRPNAPLLQSQHAYVSLPFVVATKPPAAIRQFVAAPTAAAAPSVGGVVELAVTQSFPTESPTTGGVRVLIKGTGFLAGDCVVFDRTVVAVAECSANEVICVAPPHPEGIVDLYVARPLRAGALLSQSNRLSFAFEPSVAVLKSMYFELMARVDELERMRNASFGGGASSPPLAPGSPTHYSLHPAVGGDFGGGGGGGYDEATVTGADLLDTVRALAAKLDALSPLSDPTFVLLAAQLGDVELLRIVLPKDSRAAAACARYVDENGKTALALALECNSTACICVLLEYVSPSDKIDARGRTLVGAALVHRPTPWPLLAAIRRVAMATRARAREAVAQRSAAAVRATARVPRPLSPVPRPLSPIARIAASAERAAIVSRSPPLSPPSSPPPIQARQLRPVTTIVLSPKDLSTSPTLSPVVPRVIDASSTVAAQQATQSSKRLSQRGSNPFSSAFRLSQAIDLNTVTPAMWARPTRTGYLVKRGAVRKSWRTRFFALQRTMLFYFRHNDDDEPLGAIPLKGATVSWTIEKGRRPNLFQLDAPAVKRTFYLQAESADEAEAWMSSLARAATMSGQLSAPFDVQQLHHAEFNAAGALQGLPEGWSDVLGLPTATAKAPTTSAAAATSDAQLNSS
jgi:hypothetical protein